MAIENRIDIEMAKRFLEKNFSLFRNYDENLDAFKIPGKDAILLSMYAGGLCFFILDDMHEYRFIPSFGPIGESPREPLVLNPLDKAPFQSSSEILPILSNSLAEYLRFFPEITQPKYLFLVNDRDPKYLSGRTRDFDLGKFAGVMLEKIKNYNIRISDCVFWRTDKWCFGEDFWTYIGGIVLREKGYFITHYTLTSNDLAAYFIPEYLEELLRRKLLSKGAFIEELEMLDYVQTTKNINQFETKNYELVGIEAESTDKNTRTESTTHHAINYLLSGRYAYETGYTHAFTVGPFTTLQDYSNPDIGLISCDSNGWLVFRKGNRAREPREEKVESIKNLIKSSLLRNLTFKERSELAGLKLLNLNEYFMKILKLDIDIILDKIEEKLK